MTRKVLDDRVRMVLALNTSAYMRWVETRRRVSPTQEAIDQFVRGLLDEHNFISTPDDVSMIAILALSLNVDMVESFISSSGIFDDFDKAQSQLRGCP